VLDEFLPYLTHYWRLRRFAQQVMLLVKLTNKKLENVCCYVCTVIEITLKKFCINDATDLPDYLKKRDKDHDEEERRKRS